MFALGLSEFIRNIKKNILVIIQMIFVYIIGLVTISAFYEQYKLIDGVSKIYDDTGMVIYPVSKSSDTFINEDVLKRLLKKVEKIEHTLYTSIYDKDFLIDGVGMTGVNLLAYNPELISYIPNLIEGQWCEESPKEDGIINAVVAENVPFDVHIGQIIEYADITFKVTGIISCKEMIYGGNTVWKYDDASYLDYYYNISNYKAMNDVYFFLIPYENLEKDFQLIPEEGMSWGRFATIDFEDDITEEEYEYNLKILEKNYGLHINTDVFNTESSYDYSWRLIDIKIMPMVLLFVVIMIALVISLLVSVAINILYEKKNYGIYFICGNNWRSTFKFSLVSWTILAMTSLVIAMCIYIIIGALNVFSGLSISFGWMHMVMILGITIILLIITMIIPFVMLHKIQPVSILKENNK